MPKRLIRDGINSSERVCALSGPAELLYRRLLLVVDDHGRFYGSPGTIRGACWPICPERFTDKQVFEWLQECFSSFNGRDPLLTSYSVGTIKYIQVSLFDQRVRGKARFPGPLTGTRKNAPPNAADITQDVAEVPSSGDNAPQDARASRSRSRSRESKTESETYSPLPPEGDTGQTPVGIAPETKATTRQIFELWNEEAPKLGLPMCLELTEARRVKIRTRLDWKSQLAYWQAVMAAIAKCPWLLGHGNQGWKANFDWLMKNNENSLKIAEGGSYGGKESYGATAARNIEEAERRGLIPLRPEENKFLAEDSSGEVPAKFIT